MLQEKITNDLKESMKNKDALKVSCIRMIIADMNNAFIAKQRELNDEDIISLLQKQLKQHKDSVEAFKKGNRQDLVDKETKELAIIQSYLPKQLSAEEISQIARQAIQETGARDQGAMGKVMAALMPKLKGKADGQLVKDIVARQLSGK